MGQAEPAGVSRLSHTVPVKCGLSNFCPMGKITLALKSVEFMVSSPIGSADRILEANAATPALSYACFPISYV